MGQLLAESELHGESCPKDADTKGGIDDAYSKTADSLELWALHRRTGDSRCSRRPSSRVPPCCEPRTWRRGPRTALLEASLHSPQTGRPVKVLRLQPVCPGPLEGARQLVEPHPEALAAVEDVRGVG